MKIRRGIFQGDVLSPLLFVIAMMPLNNILREIHKIHKSQEKITKSTLTTSNCLPKWKRILKKPLIQAVRIYSQYIEMGVRLERRAMLIMKSGKRKSIDGIELLTNKKRECSEKKKFLNTWEYWNRTPSNKRKWEEKFKENSSGERENYWKPNFLAAISSMR